jgi:hypothetical protein
MAIKAGVWRVLFCGVRVDRLNGASVSTRGTVWAVPIVVAGLVALLCGCSGNGQPGATPSASTPVAVSSAPTSTSSATASATPAQGEVAISYSGGRVTSSAGNRLTVSHGQTVRLVVTSDTAEEVHVHGYDRRADVAAGQTVTVAFTADIPGIFEIELEKSHKLLLRLEVR